MHLQNSLQNIIKSYFLHELETKRKKKKIKLYILEVKTFLKVPPPMILWIDASD